MKRLIATLCAVAFVCASVLGSDNKKEESKPAPKRVVLTPDQVKLVRQVEEGLKELEREYRQQQAVINAQGAGILRVIAQQGGLGDKQYKLVPEGDGFALEEVVQETRGHGEAETRGRGDAGTRRPEKPAAPPDTPSPTDPGAPHDKPRASSPQPKQPL
jgi:hypothetical protein